jgi:hypothetical protein
MKRGREKYKSNSKSAPAPAPSDVCYVLVCGVKIRLGPLGSRESASREHVTLPGSSTLRDVNLGFLQFVLHGSRVAAEFAHSFTRRCVAQPLLDYCKAPMLALILYFACFSWRLYGVSLSEAETTFMANLKHRPSEKPDIPFLCRYAQVGIVSQTYCFTRWMSY